MNTSVHSVCIVRLIVFVKGEEDKHLLEEKNPTNLGRGCRVLKKYYLSIVYDVKRREHCLTD